MTLDTKELLSFLDTIFPVVNPNSTLVSTQNFMFSESDGKLKLTAEGMDCRASIVTGFDYEGDGFLINASDIVRALRCVSSARVNIELQENQAKFTHSAGFFQIPKEGCETFPNPDNLEIVEEFTASPEILEALVKSVSFCSIEDVFRPQLTGVAIGAGCVAATNANYAINTDFSDLDEISQIIIPAKVINTMKNVINIGYECEFSVASNRAFTFQDDVEFSFPLIDAKFVNHRLMFPKDEADCVVTLNGDSFVKLIKSASVLNSKETKCVSLSFKDGKVAIKGSDIAYAREFEAIGDVLHKGDLRIFFNHELLSKSAAVFDDFDANFHAAFNKPSVFKSGDTSVVICQMKP